jgi:hypothetical protein
MIINDGSDSFFYKVNQLDICCLIPKNQDQISTQSRIKDDILSLKRLAFFFMILSRVDARGNLSGNDEPED